MDQNNVGSNKLKYGLKTSFKTWIKTMWVQNKLKY